MTDGDTADGGACPECGARFGFTTGADGTTIRVCPRCLRTYGEVRP